MKLPATTSGNEDGAISRPSMRTLLKTLVCVPPISVLPLKVTVPVLARKVPMLVHAPATAMVPVGAWRLPLIVTLLKSVVPAPWTELVLAKITDPPL